MNELQVFNNPAFGTVRTIEEDGKVLFCGSDVAKALGYQNPSRDVQRHCKSTADRCTTDTVGRQQHMLFIPENNSCVNACPIVFTPLKSNTTS